MKKSRLLISAIILGIVAFSTGQAQSLKSRRGTWGVERQGNAGYKKPDYPAQDIYQEAMNYSSGSNGVKRDIYIAFEKYLQAANLGNPLAQYKVGACYYYGSGVEKNRKQAFVYWTKASEADIPDAHHELGRMYYRGEECKRNYGTAIDLFHKAEAANVPGSFYMLGMCYLDGTGVKRDKEKAAEYFKKAADRGNHDAKQELEKLQ